MLLMFTIISSLIIAYYGVIVGQTALALQSCVHKDTAAHCIQSLEKAARFPTEFYFQGIFKEFFRKFSLKKTFIRVGPRASFCREIMHVQVKHRASSAMIVGSPLSFFSLYFIKFYNQFELWIMLRTSIVKEFLSRYLNRCRSLI